jgi:hypothetical protein
MFYPIFKKIFHDHIEAEKHASFINGQHQRQKERDERDQVVEEFNLSEAIGKKAIYVPNEWMDPSFLIITGITTITKSNRLVHEAYDVLKDVKTFAFVNSIYLADEQMVLAMLKLNPFERWNMSAGKVYFNNMWTKSYPLNDEDVTKPDVLEAKLRQVNFI